MDRVTQRKLRPFLTALHERSRLSRVSTKKPNRTAASSVFVRLKTEDRQLMEEAIARLLEDVPEAKLTIGRFLVAAGVARAREILGKR